MSYLKHFDTMKAVEATITTASVTTGTITDLTFTTATGSSITLTDLTMASAKWDDLRFPAQGINPAGLASPPIVDTGTIMPGTLLFSPTIDHVVAGVAQMPHNWKAESVLHPHLHWCPTNTDTGDVVWRFSWNKATIGGVFATAMSSTTVTTAAKGTDLYHQYTDLGDVDMAGVTGVSGIVVWKVERVASATQDNYTGDARLLEFDFHYEIDDLGSDTETAK